MVWGLQGTGSNDNIVTKTFGTAGGRQHWVFFALTQRVAGLIGLL